MTRARKLPTDFQGPSLSTFLTSLHPLSLLDVLLQLPLDVLQRAFEAVAGSPHAVWDSLQGLRASSKVGRELCNSCVQEVDVKLPQNPAVTPRLALALNQLTELRNLSIRDPAELNEQPDPQELAQRSQKLTGLLRYLQEAPLIQELLFENTSVGSHSLALVAQQFSNLDSLCLKACSADDADLLRPLSACTRLASLSILQPSKGRLPDFESALPALSALTQLTSFCWDGKVRNLQLLDHIGRLTNLRVLKLFTKDERGRRKYGVDAKLIILPLTQLQELHVAVVNALLLPSLDGNTSITKLVFEEAYLGPNDAFALIEGHWQPICIPNLQEIVLSEAGCRSLNLEMLRMLLGVAPALQSAKWSENCSLSWRVMERNVSENIAWLSQQSDKLPAYMFEYLWLTGGPIDEQLLIQQVMTWPVMHACKRLQLVGVHLTPLTTAALIQKFPRVEKLGVMLLHHDEMGRMSGPAMRGFLAWQQLNSIKVVTKLPQIVEASFRADCLSQGIAFEMNYRGAAV